MKKTLLLLPLLLAMFVFPGKAQITVFSEGFEGNGLPSGWTIIDADNDGQNWMHSSVYGDLMGGHTGEGAFVSYSYDAWIGEDLFPDNWLVSPAISLTGSSTLTFWRMVAYGFPADHYGVYVSTTSATDPTAFTLLFEETPTSQTNSWTTHTVSLENYTGNTIYLAFRHFNCTGQMLIALDDITITSSTTEPTITTHPMNLHFSNAPLGAPTASQLLHVNTYNITGNITASTVEPFEVSMDDTTYGQTVTMLNTDTALYVRYNPIFAGEDTAILTLSDGTTNANVYLFGNSVDCGNFTLPYVQNFNDIPENTIPECWSQINPFDGYPKTTDDYTSLGDNVLMFKCDFNNYQPIYAVLPQMPDDLSNLQIRFNTFREGSNSGTLYVGYVTDPTDSSTFVSVWSINAAQIGDNNPHPYIVSFENVVDDPYATRHIAFKYDNNKNWYWFVDDINVEEIPSCGFPTALAVGQVTSTSAIVSWGGSADSYNLYYKTSADTGWVVIQNVTIGEDGFTLEDLIPATTYYWYVESVCDDGSTIQSMTTSSFTTECAVFVAPFSQNFDASANLPICWGTYTGLADLVFTGTELSPATSSNWVFNSSYVFGLRHAKLNIYGASCNKWLVTPAIDLSALSNPALTFDMALTGYNNANPISNPTGQPDDKFMVLISTDNGDSWSADNATVWSNDGNGDYVFNQIPAAGQEVTIPLSDYAGQTVMIAFYGESTVSNGDNDLHIDNVTVSNLATCQKPANLTLVSVTGNEVTLNWDESGSATAWNIEYGPSGFQHGAGNATLVNATSHPYTINNLSAMSYDFYVQSNCGDEQSNWAGPISATPGTYNMGITGADTLTSCSLIIYDNGGANGNYSSNCNAILVIYPETEGSSVAVSGTYATENNWDYLRIYDGAGTNGTLLGEFCGNGTVPSTMSSAGPLTIKFTSDGGVQSGGFELTVSCASCPPPGNLAASNVSSESADLTWTGSASEYLVEYKAESDTAWITENTSDTTFSLSSLAASTSYTVNVYSDCDGDYSPAASITFATTMESTSLPYSTDFSEGNDRNWLFYNGSCSNFWKIGSVSDSTAALFVTHDGTTPGYHVNSFSVVSAEKLFTIGDADELFISFDVNVGGESTFDYLKVFFAPSDSIYPAINTNRYYAANNYSNFALNFSDYLQYSGSSSFPYKFNLTGDNTVHVSVTMPNPNTNPTANSTAKLVFLWKNDQSDGTQPAAIIYNVSVETLSCPMPTNLTVSNLTTNSADVSWTPVGSETEWNLEYKSASDSVWTLVSVAAPFHTLTDLLIATEYDVRVQANCGDGDLSVFTMQSFTTDSTVLLPTVVTGTASSVTEYGAVLNGFISSLGNIDITSRGFEWKPASASTFSSVIVSDGYPLFSHFISNLSPNTDYVFKAFITTGDTILYGQEETFTTLPDTCETPSDLTATEINTDNINITWAVSPNSIGWIIRYRQVNGPWIYASSDINSYHVSGLIPGNTYQIQVQADCGIHYPSEWATITVTTLTDGISDHLLNSITLYPNPAKEIVNVQCTMYNVQLEGIEVIDVYGKVVRTIVGANNDSPLQTRINISGLADGMYFVRVTTDEGVATKPFIVKR